MQSNKAKFGSKKTDTKGSRLHKEVVGKVAAVGCDPIMFMAFLVNGDHEALDLIEMAYDESSDEPVAQRIQEIPIELRFSAAKELANYIYPKRRSVDLESSNNQGDLHVSVVQFSNPEQLENPGDSNNSGGTGE